MERSLLSGLCSVLAAVVPAAAAATPAVQLKSSRGVVTATLGADHRPLHASESIAPATILETGDGAQAEVRMRDGTDLALGANSSLIVLGTHDPTGHVVPARRSGLVRGTVHIEVPSASVSAGSAVPIATVAGDVRVTRGGEALITVDARRLTRVAVYRGRAYVQVGTHTEVVGAGFGVRVALGDATVQVVPLPGAPVWTAPPAAATLTRGRQVALRGEYAPVGDAPARWHVQWSRDPGFSSVALDQVLGAESRAVDAGEQPPGAYFVRVSGLTGEGIEGPFSPVREAVIAAVRVTPPTSGHPALLEPVALMRCGLDGGPMAPMRAPLALAAGRWHRLQCAPPSSEGPAAEIALSPDGAGEIVPELVVDGDSGLRLLALHLHDVRGMPVTSADVRVVAIGHAAVTQPHESDVQGSYTMALSSEGAAPVRLHFVVNESLEFDQVVR